MDADDRRESNGADHKGCERMTEDDLPMSPRAVLTNLRGFDLWGFQDYHMSRAEAETAKWVFEEYLGLEHGKEQGNEDE